MFKQLCAHSGADDAVEDIIIDPDFDCLPQSIENLSIGVICCCAGGHAGIEQGRVCRWVPLPIVHGPLPCGTVYVSVYTPVCPQPDTEQYSVSTQ